jgi:hypothetical protein
MLSAILSKPNFNKFLFVLLTWIAQQASFIFFGIKFNLYGFIGIGILEILIIAFLFVKSRKIVFEDN